ncbi:MAG: 16S rRNA (adenine(1518)-N(6)/adenine(1519)-N(6))-dimethyltransferase RsmA [Candidatus Thermoplasmatota archaeon]|nr:16S rRNA (adenine(1518)-N(6)/adenine(1519)-N(6))-dimethyltransferase RsmA [Candidatus Thermoplasmatota archaeon]
MKNQFSRKFGQVLLKDRNIARFEARLFDCAPGDSILEIGPGEGALTEFLLEPGPSLTVIESDHRYVDILQERFRTQIDNKRLTIHKKDFLDVKGGKYDAIFGNIPYHISSEILFSLSKFTFRKCILMVQLEFAKRMRAIQGQDDYSRLSVNTYLRYKVRIEKVVNRKCFQPVPRVDSAIVSLVPRNEYREEDILKADSVVRELFSNRRKKIGTVYRNCPGNIKDRRVEEISPEEIFLFALSKGTIY